MKGIVLKCPVPCNDGQGPTRCPKKVRNRLRVWGRLNANPYVFRGLLLQKLRTNWKTAWTMTWDDDMEVGFSWCIGLWAT